MLKIKIKRKRNLDSLLFYRDKKAFLNSKAFKNCHVIRAESPPLSFCFGITKILNKKISYLFLQFFCFFKEFLTYFFEVLKIFLFIRIFIHLRFYFLCNLSCLVYYIRDPDYAKTKNLKQYNFHS